MSMPVISEEDSIGLSTSPRVDKTEEQDVEFLSHLNKEEDKESEVNEESYFAKIPPQIIKKIISYLPLSDKKSTRLISSLWVTLTNDLVTINVPKMCNGTRYELCTHIGTVEISHLYTTTLTEPIESLITTKFHTGPKIISIIFENPEITTDNMIWLLTQCYSVKEIQFILDSDDANDFEMKRKRLEDMFQNVETMKAINMCSRTLRSFVIKSTGYSSNFNPSASLYFDCSIFKSCRLLQSFIIMQLPWLKLKNLDELPLQIAHIVLQLEEQNNNCEDEHNEQRQLKTNWEAINNNNSNEEEERELSKSARANHMQLRNIGFVDFSGPVKLKSFKFTMRLTKIKRFYSDDHTKLSGQDILEIIPKLRRDTVSKIMWFSNIQNYQIMQERTKI